LKSWIVLSGSEMRCVTLVLGWRCESSTRAVRKLNDSNVAGTVLPISSHCMRLLFIIPGGQGNPIQAVGSDADGAADGQSRGAARSIAS
jgi:hypothetical protein